MIEEMREEERMYKSDNELFEIKHIHQSIISITISSFNFLSHPVIVPIRTPNLVPVKHIYRLN